ncbi:SNF2-like protein [Penicillium sp. DV-2018c]|nr:SNF2-like protein [Penicillium sp. DV-2018c]
MSSSIATTSRDSAPTTIPGLEGQPRKTPQHRAWEPVRIGEQKWAVVFRNEREMATYLGFRHTSELRKFAISWVCLAANKYFSPTAENTSKRGPISLLSDDDARREIAEVQGCPLVAWPYQQHDREHRNWKILAWCFLKMAADIRRYNDATDEANDQLTKKERGDFKLRHKDMFSKGLAFPDETIGFPKPNIGPFEGRGETELEVYNRCWEVMRYLNHGFYEKHWARRFQTAHVVNNGKYASEADCVPWMRGLIPGILPAEAPSAEVRRQFGVQRGIQDDSEILYWRLGKPYIPVNLIWRFAEPDDGSRPAEQILERAQMKDIPVPPAEQTIPWDPRACKGGAHFRVGIRSLLSCEELGLRLQHLEFHYHSGEGNLWIVKDALQITWDEMTGDFTHRENSAFFVLAVLQVVAE